MTVSFISLFDDASIVKMLRVVVRFQLDRLAVWGMPGWRSTGLVPDA